MRVITVVVAGLITGAAVFGAQQALADLPTMEPPCITCEPTWSQTKQAAGWVPFGAYEGHPDCYILVGDTTLMECRDGFTTTS